MLNDTPQNSRLATTLRCCWQVVLACGAAGFGCSGTDDPEASQAPAGVDGGDTSSTGAPSTTTGGSMTTGAAGPAASSSVSGAVSTTGLAATTNAGLTAGTGGATTSMGTTSDGPSSTGTTGSTGAGGLPTDTTSGGEATTDGSTSSTTGGETGDDWYPCDGDPSGYDVVVTGSGDSWSVQGGSSYPDMASAMAAGYGQLSGTTKESMLVQGDGSIDANAQLKLPSNIILNICGTINVTGSATGSDRSPLYARDRTDIDIPHARITGNAQYGMFFRDVSNLHLGRIELVFDVDNSGIGIRIDNNPSNGAGAEKVTNIQIDQVYAEGTGSHGIETYGVDDLRIGQVEGVDTGECGVLLNDTTNAEVGSVHCDNCAAGTGYAAFRIANSAGKIGSDWPAGNIHVGEVYARNGGRGIFSVSGSGGLTIDRIDIADTGNNAILLQNCYNTTIAEQAGTVSNGDVLLSNDTDNTNEGVYEASSDVTLKNLTLTNGATLSEAWCDLGDRGNRAEAISGGSVDMCFGD